MLTMAMRTLMTSCRTTASRVSLLLLLAFSTDLKSVVCCDHYYEKKIILRVNNKLTIISKQL